MSRFDVVVVGAGPSGLAVAIELGRRGVCCLVVERDARAGYAPRAKTTHTRTREHLRRWGIAADLAAASPFGLDYPPDVIFATRLNGKMITRFENAFRCSPARDDLYAEHAQWIPQYKLEAVLRRHAATLPTVEIRFGCAFEGADQDAAGVHVRLRQGGEAQTVHARYLVGADGARSALRAQMGIAMQGRGRLSENTVTVFRSPGLAARVTLPRAIMYWLVNPEAPGGITPLDVGDVWTCSTARHLRSPEEAARLIDAVAGFPVGAEVLKIDPWTAHALVADRYRDGRFFLIGDACHLHPPYGGFGMNMGFADGVDLGWKLAAVLEGWGGERLLDSYEVERRPVHVRVIAEAENNQRVVSKDLVVPAIEAEGPEGDAARAEVARRTVETKTREFRTLGVVLGARYAASPVIVPDGSEPPPDDHARYVPNAVPGSRAPHLWLGEGTGPGASLFDHFGPGYTLLVLRPAAEGEAAPLVAEARRRFMPLKVLPVRHPAARDLYAASFALIRPDQHVAWRGDQLPEAKGLLDAVSGQVAWMDAELAAMAGG